MFQDENVRKVKPAESPQTRDIRTLWPRACRHETRRESSKQARVVHQTFIEPPC